MIRRGHCKDVRSTDEAILKHTLSLRVRRMANEAISVLPKPQTPNPKPFIFFLCFALFFSSAHAFTATARVSRTNAAVAESLSLKIEFSGIPANATLAGPWDGSGWQAPVVLLQSYPIESKGSDATWMGVFTVIDTGNHAVPAFDIYAIRGSDTVRAKTNSIPLTIHSTIKGSGLDTLLKPDQPVKTIPPSFYEWLFWIGTPIFLAALVYGLIRYRKYRKSLLPPPPPPPPPSPEKVAFERLSQIRIDAKWQLGDLKGFQTDLIDTLKEYIDVRFGYDAREKTTTDLREHEVVEMLGENEHRFFIALLSIADEIKFARGEIAANRCLEGIQEAEQLVGTWGIRWQQQQDAKRAEQEKAKSLEPQPATAKPIALESEPAMTIRSTVSKETSDTSSKRTLLDEIRESEQSGEGRAQ